ncbi:MAG TPA: magnesium/cobalt transporter CorA [Candidatus Acidoferrum sp.]|nr:magnesium/cobalt transporter CorA [Candidatus Acidoferrum sp.]
MPRYLIATQGALTEPVSGDIARSLQERKQGFWLDIENPDADDYALLEQTFKFHPLTLEDIRHQNQRPKVEEYPGYVFVVLFTAELDGARALIREHHLFLSSQYLVSVHIEPSDPLNRLRARIKANPDLTHRKLAYLFYLVVDQLVDALFPVLDQLDDATDAVEDGIIDRPDTAALGELSDLKRTVVDLRKVLGAQRDVFQRLTTSGLGDPGESSLPTDFPREMSIYYRDVYDHLVRQYETVDSLRDLLSTAMDVYLSTVSNRLNLRITRLTIFATLFLPLTFLTGFFGMNFAWLVGHIAPTWTFWILAVGVMVVVSAFQLWYYRRLGWL